MIKAKNGEPIILGTAYDSEDLIVQITEVDFNQMMEAYNS